MTNDEFKNPSPAWTGASYDSNNSQSANEITKNTGISSTYNNASPYQSYIDLQPIRNIYIYIFIVVLEITILSLVMGKHLLSNKYPRLLISMR